MAVDMSDVEEINEVAVEDEADDATSKVRLPQMTEHESWMSPLFAFVASHSDFHGSHSRVVGHLRYLSANTNTVVGEGDLCRET